MLMSSLPSFPDGTHIAPALSNISITELSNVIPAGDEAMSRESIIHQLSSMPASLLNNLRAESDADVCIDEQKFDIFDVPPKSIIDDRRNRMRDRLAPSNSIIGVCMVCAREFAKKELKNMDIPSIMFEDLLKPKVSNPGHILTGGMLLHGPAVEVEDDGARGPCCDQCLVLVDTDNLPPYALANGLWVGEIPEELNGLSMLEQILIARCSRATYTIDITSSKGVFHNRVATLPSHASMINDGALPRRMPLPMDYISKLLVISLCGVTQLQDGDVHPPIISVRRSRVSRALRWLKMNNKLYRGITIDESRLAVLPNDGVPYIVNKRIVFYPTNFEYKSRNRRSLDETEECFSVDSEDMIGGGVEYFKCDPSTLESHRLLLIFPWLFPRGVGGPTNRSPTSLQFVPLARWCLQYGDKRFRNSLPFITHLLWEIQECQVRNAYDKFDTMGILQRPPFGAVLLRTDLEEAIAGYEVNRDSYLAKLLHLQVGLTESIDGCPTSRLIVPNCVRGLTLDNNPPNLFFTIDPWKGNEVLGRMMAGAEYVQTEFIASQHMQQVNSEFLEGNPYISAQLFHLVCFAICNDLFGIGEKSGGNNRETGVLGDVKGYVGFVTPSKALGHDSVPVLRLYLWLNNNKTADEMSTLLQSRAFRGHLQAFISATIHCDLEDLDSGYGEDSVCAFNALPRPQYNGDYLSNRWTTRSPSAWVADDGGWGPKLRVIKYLPWSPHLHPIFHHADLFTYGPGSKSKVMVGALDAARLTGTDWSAKTDWATLTEVIKYAEPSSFKEIAVRFACASYRRLRRPAYESVRCVLGHSPMLSSHLFYNVYTDYLLESLWTASGDGLGSMRNGSANSINWSLGRLQMEKYIARSDGEPSRSTNYLDFFLKSDELMDVALLFVGRDLPSPISNRNLYCASMLALLKPWRCIEDLSFGFADHGLAFEKFLDGASPKTVSRVDHLRFGY